MASPNDLAAECRALSEQVRELQQKLLESDRTLQALRTQATHDALTRLPNRVLFRDRLHGACARASRLRTMFAVAYLDLDRFKLVNDDHGHAAGDALLVAVAGRLLRTLRTSDTVARLAGDEFGMLFENIDGPATAEAVAHKLHRVLVAPYELAVPERPDKLALRIGASIGIAVFPDDATEMDRLMFRADMAMYAAKDGGDGVRMYRDDLMEFVPPGSKARMPADGRTLPQRH